MAETVAELRTQLVSAIEPGFGGRLLARGLARGLIWTEGELPTGSPEFVESLTDDLLDYGHAVLALALRLRALSPGDETLERAFLVAGEAIEAAVLRGAARPDRGFHRISAAIAFHLGRYAARAYSLLPPVADTENLSPQEAVLLMLLRRNLDAMRAESAAWLLNEENVDDRLAERLISDVDFDESDATQIVLTCAFMRAMLLYDHAITAGVRESAQMARTKLFELSAIAGELHAINHWWTATLAAHLIDELWGLSFYEQVPMLHNSNSNADAWAGLRRGYIQRLRANARSAIELWPSQLEAARRAIDINDDLVVALPTSGGKTRIAELCILRALADGKRAVYITPLRALSAQVERDLTQTFAPLGFSVSALYGSAGISRGDAVTLREGRIVVATPEKLDFALRNDPSIIDDVGIIVLDEGHMLGAEEREVRYEALVQRLLRREDAAARRMVCLSALFPTADEMEDLVKWFRQDEPGTPVHSNWRPTRQRFGTLDWRGNRGRLELRVEQETPFVPRFIEAVAPPKGSRRRKSFPSDKNELTLAAAWRFVEQGKDVLIYSTLRKSVEKLGRVVMDCVRRGLLPPLAKLNTRIRDAMAIGAEWLGNDHPAVGCLAYGVALHHGGLPRPFLNEVERLLRSGDCRVTIASPTLAQGVNLSASVLIVPSIWRNGEMIPAKEFANVAGRAGRAFVDVEGLIVHIVWEPEDSGKRAWTNKKWWELVNAAKAPKIDSGLLLLASALFKRLATVAGVPSAEVIEYVTGNDTAWQYLIVRPDGVADDAGERDLASLDAAVLALLDTDLKLDELSSALSDVLAGSLFSRQLEQESADVRALIRAFVVARAETIWRISNAAQRKGYHAAGIGLRAGQFLDANVSHLVEQLLRLEAAVTVGDGDLAAEAAVQFAEVVFKTPPFSAPDMPSNWRDALRMWIVGSPAAEVIRLAGGDGVYLLQEALTYRLPWAMEAVRVHSSAIGHPESDEITGFGALAVESGSANTSVITLMRSGLASREAATAAVTSTGASFHDRISMLAWLVSEEVRTMTANENWPTVQSRSAWLHFIKSEESGDRRTWSRETFVLQALWSTSSPPAGTYVVIKILPETGEALVLNTEYSRLGLLRSVLPRLETNIVTAVVDGSGAVNIEFFGPQS